MQNEEIIKLVREVAKSGLSHFEYTEGNIHIVMDGKDMKEEAFEGYTLSNGKIRIKVHPHGAELKELTRLETGENVLWYGDPAYWNRSAPVLFPFVGMVRDKVYRYQGAEYPMGQHGFARDMDFTLLREDSHSIWFFLESNEETLKKYPFPFRLEIGYQLEEASVKVCWRVCNTGSGPLYFSIGAHPAFLCPLQEGTAQDQYAFLLKDPEGKPLTSFVNTVFGSKGLVTGEKEIRETPQGILPIEEHLFDRDALVIENYQVGETAILNPQNKPYLTVSFDAPVVGLWSPPGKHAPFVCIEPWYGRCDSESFRGELADREWGNTLTPGEIFTANYTITL